MRGKDTACVEPCLFELTIYVGGDYEVAFLFDHIEQLTIERQGLWTVAGKPDVLGPLSPQFFFGLEGIERCRIKVGNAVAVRPLTELTSKIFTGKSLMPAIMALIVWGKEHFEEVVTD